MITEKDMDNIHRYLEELKKLEKVVGEQLETITISDIRHMVSDMYSVDGPIHDLYLEHALDQAAMESDLYQIYMIKCNIWEVIPKIKKEA